MILNHLWKKKILYDFLKAGVNLTDIVQEDWADIPGESWKLKSRYTQRTIARWLRIPAPKEKTEEVQKKKYCCIIEIDGCVNIPLEIPEKYFIQVVSQEDKGIFFTRTKDMLLVPTNEDYIEIMWDHILHIIEKKYEAIQQIKEKSLSEMRRNIIQMKGK